MSRDPVCQLEILERIAVALEKLASRMGPTEPISLMYHFGKLYNLADMVDSHEAARIHRVIMRILQGGEESPKAPVGALLTPTDAIKEPGYKKQAEDRTGPFWGPP